VKELMKMTYPTGAEARVALQRAEQARQQVIDRIGMPWWYWWGLAACWVALGVLADLHAAWWLVSAATLAVGAGHSYVFQRLVAGRRQTGDVKVSADVAGRNLQLLVIGFLLALVGVTVAVALGLAADGTEHPSIWACSFVAIVLLLGGPRVMARIRDRAKRRTLAQ
jgi:hypothetical protein